MERELSTLDSRLKANGLAVKTKMTRSSRRAPSPQVACWRRPRLCKSSGLSSTCISRICLGWLFDFDCRGRQHRARQSTVVLTRQDALARCAQMASACVALNLPTPPSRLPGIHIHYLACDPIIPMVTWITVALAVSTRYPNATVQCPFAIPRTTSRSWSPFSRRAQRSPTLSSFVGPRVIASVQQLVHRSLHRSSTSHVALILRVMWRGLSRTPPTPLARRARHFIQHVSVFSSRSL